MSLQDTLKEYRSIKSKELNIPAYCIFTNAIIVSLCNSPPQNSRMLLDIKGIGTKKIEKYGKDILEMCKDKEPSITANDTSGDNSEEPNVGGRLWQVVGCGRAGRTPVFTTIPADIQLSEEQKLVIQICDEGKNVFISGPGGTGKSLLIRILRDRLSVMKNIQVCALTGAAAELLGCNAKTIHSWSGTGISRSGPDKIIHRIMKRKKIVDNWKNIDALIIDEVSMMSMKYFDTLDFIGRHVRQTDQPFGGIQLIFSGDFHQLPPVGNDNNVDSCRFCFESNKWNDTFSDSIILKQIFRQSDPLFMKILRQVRRGAISQKTYDILQSRILTKGGLSYDKDIQPPIITPRRDTVDSINVQKMARLDGNSHTYTMRVYNAKKDASLTSSEKKEIEEVRRGMNAEETLILKVGARVMCVANLEMDGTNQIVNGSQGIVEEFVDDFPVVRFKNGIKKIIKNHIWLGENVKHVGLKQLPLILSWAITIHKSQGITLESAIIDAGDDIFEHGQTYVAFSRVKSLNGLYLHKFNHKRISTDPIVKKYYDSIDTFTI